MVLADNIDNIDDIRPDLEEWLSYAGKVKPDLDQGVEVMLLDRVDLTGGRRPETFSLNKYIGRKFRLITPLWISVYPYITNIDILTGLVTFFIDKIDLKLHNEETGRFLRTSDIQEVTKDIRDDEEIFIIRTLNTNYIIKKV